MVDNHPRFLQSFRFFFLIHCLICDLHPAHLTPNTELTSVQRAAFLSLLENGVSPSTIARDFQISRNTPLARGQTVSAERQDQEEDLSARQHPEWRSMGEIMRDLDEGVSKSTVRKALMEEGLWTVGGNNVKMGRREETEKTEKTEKNDVETSQFMPASEASVE
ncbi:hypothetical protein N7539_003785 [Penicillium diatomitis]|uniref:Transposase Tc1-like domain-containing protein n=1 Tax=Penicillium diatomitis TaxID=2819901 RepID=A0A9W9XCJ1_9EURO|nr:uncharacterized protein N7539_003785 [Penicillium diatomitis]KAJ5488895.1 hypothetical protein N7539_003785 [Penicillium diatomitis]